jgi:hypothetical protein
MLAMAVGNCGLILCLYLDELSEAVGNALGFKESKGFLAMLGQIFEEAFFCFGFLWASCRNKTYGNIHITARHLVPSSSCELFLLFQPSFFTYWECNRFQWIRKCVKGQIVIELCWGENCCWPSAYFSL